jgi:LysM repeat protein
MRVRSLRLLIVFVAILSTAGPASSARAECTNNYTVRRGDSWWSIAEAEGVTLKSILTLNRAKASTMIKPGQIVCLPSDELLATTRYTQREVIEIIREIWPDELEDRAIAIARRESKLQPGVIGIPNKCCYGLFQIYYRWHKQWLPKVGVVRASQLLDPRLNTKAAYQIYLRNNGWGPWE